MLLARLHIAKGQSQVALALLKQWKHEASTAHREYSELQILLLEALAHEQAGARAQAKATLLEAIKRARITFNTADIGGRSILMVGENVLARTMRPDLAPLISTSALFR